MKRLILTLAAMLTMASSAFAQIGSLSSDLVFTPIIPCRIVDTRNANAGVIPAAASRTFRGLAASYTTQGGSATNCGLPLTNTIAALAVNLLVIVPAGEGWIAAWPAGTAMPLVSNLNYKANDVLANSAILKINQTTPYEFHVYTVAATHLAVDVTGYYSKPVATALQCVITGTNQVTVAAAATGAVAAPACGTGYTATANFCDTSTLEMMPFTVDTGCVAKNNTTAAQAIFAYQRCCQIPGK